MKSLSLKQKLAILLGLLLIGAGFYLELKSGREVVEEEVVVEKPVAENPKVLGLSVEGRKIEAYTYGAGTETVLFVGGIHGGYEWNSVLLAYQMMDYLKENPASIPSNLKVVIIPSLNPDGVFAVTGKEGRFGASDASKDEAVLSFARFNANKVDLNRNFDCKWQSESTWRSKTVSAGSSAFSEPEAKALRDFVLAEKPKSVTFWHSQANAVYASECENGVLAGTKDVMNAYASAAGYKSVESFDAYPVTGDAEGWLASINIPAITVELSTHEAVEFEKNLAGVKALLEYHTSKMVN